MIELSIEMRGRYKRRVSSINPIGSTLMVYSMPPFLNSRRNFGASFNLEDKITLVFTHYSKI